MQELETLRVELAGTRRALEAASRQQQQALAAAEKGGSQQKQQLQRAQAQVPRCRGFAGGWAAAVGGATCDFAMAGRPAAGDAGQHTVKLHMLNVAIALHPPRFWPH